MRDILENYKKQKLDWSLKLSIELFRHYVKQQAA